MKCFPVLEHLALQYLKVKHCQDGLPLVNGTKVRQSWTQCQGIVHFYLTPTSESAVCNEPSEIDFFTNFGCLLLWPGRRRLMWALSLSWLSAHYWLIRSQQPCVTVYVGSDQYLSQRDHRMSLEGLLTMVGLNQWWNKSIGQIQRVYECIGM